MDADFTNIGPAKGPWLYRDSRLPGAIGVLRAPEDHMPVGIALGAGRRDDGVKLWKITLRDGTELTGLWVVVDRQFRPAP